MSNFKAIVHYHFKKGQEEQGFKLLENEISKKCKEKGCQGIELLRNEKQPHLVLGIATWNSLEEARHFQTIWQEKEKEIAKMCQEPPHHEFFKSCLHLSGEHKKAA